MKTFYSLFASFFILIATYAQDSSNVKFKNEVFSKVYIEAEFPGGNRAWIEYLSNNLDTDVPNKKGAPEGVYQVIVKFIVNKEGGLDSIQVEKDPGYGTAEEVMRVIKKSPKWKVAVQNNSNAITWRRQPVNFVVAEQKKKRRKKSF